MTKDELVKQMKEYDQQAELALANYHRLKGASFALKAVIDSMSDKDDTKKEPADG